MIKRLFDILFSFSVITCLSPVFLICALAIKLSTKGPIFYAHPRIGKGGRPFGCLKFRTMHIDAAGKLKALLESDPALMQEWKTYYKLKADPRITSVGKWFRKVSLDELPQFINVFRGDMSIVGPRPLTQDEVENYLKEKAPKILSIRPGLTTLWIVKGRNRFTLKERIELEEFYIDNRSFWFDLRLIFQTAYQVLFPKGAY